MHFANGTSDQLSRTIGRCRFNRKRGYVLIICMIVIAISSSIVLTTFQLLKLQTAEAIARRDSVLISAVQTAGIEHAIAHLMDQPSYRGSLGPFALPNGSGDSYQLHLSDSSGDIQIDVVAFLGTRSYSHNLQISATALNSRRAALGLSTPVDSTDTSPPGGRVLGSRVGR